MEQNNKYARGKIYTIRSPLTDKVYVGSTVNKLSKRFNEHKSGYKGYKNGSGKYIAVYDIFDIDIEGAYIELHEYYSCNNKQELNRREGEVTRMTPNFVNKNIAGRTNNEYHLDNKEKRNEQNRQYYRDNIERHRERNRQYHLDNKEKRNEYSKKYNQENKERIKELAARKTECQCGTILNIYCISRHLKTKKHKTWVFNQWNELNHL